MSKNLTISVDEITLERAMAIAQRRGIGLQDLLCQMLESLAGNRSVDSTADDVLLLLRGSAGRSDGKPITRADAYDTRA